MISTQIFPNLTRPPRRRCRICHRSPRATVHKTNCRGAPDSLVDLNRLLRWTSRCPTLVPEPQSNCRGASPPLRNLASTPSTRRQLDGVALMLAHRSPRWMLLHSKCRTLRRWIRRSSASACVEINQRVTLVTFTSRRWRGCPKFDFHTDIPKFDAPAAPKMDMPSFSASDSA